MPRPTLFYGLLLSLLLLCLQIIQPLLRFERELILNGEVWRILSGHFVHTNLAHLLLNLSGLWVFLWLCGSYLNLPRLTATIATLGISISLLLLALHPGLHWYVGFSGILYGLFLLGGIKLAVADDPLTGLALIGLLVLKTGLDLYNGNSALSESLIDAQVILPAHLYGLLTGLLLALPDIYHRYRLRM